ncbi:MAG TPA: galactokinase [Candidatus Sulfopaludibacter sp.]|nr:galactokinase [Candidatus Sulfopaludibacter sp.]
MINRFRERFGSVEGLRTFRAPGRTNLIGEHTDYNMGLVLPVALDLATDVAAAPNADGKLRIYSEHRDEMAEWDLAAVGGLAASHHWSDYPIGVAHELMALGFDLRPANLYIRSTVPEGSGLSSSAALEVSSALAFLNGREIDPLELAKLCQRAERNFVGVPCGIMDQYIAVFGRAHCAVEIDCRSLGNRLVTLPPEITFVAVNTMVKHALAGSAYQDRVQECAAAVAGVQSRFPEAQSLRDVTPEQFESVAGELEPLIARRGRHVVTEIARVGRFVEASSRVELTEMGALMVQSHRSLQHDYEVSCAELDFLVDTALTLPGVFGSRMTGGGFGGCTVTMLRPDDVPAFREAITAAYQGRYGVEPAIYPCNPSDGARELA